MPKLTSVDYNYDEYGEILIEIATQAAMGGETDSVRMIKPQIVIRDSTGPVPKEK